MAEDMKPACETATRLNERLDREEGEREAASAEREAAEAHMKVAEDDVLRRVAERLSSGALH